MVYIINLIKFINKIDKNVALFRCVTNKVSIYNYSVFENRLLQKFRYH